MTVRLDKYLSNRGLGSRREVNLWIREGRVRVNGEVITVGKKLLREGDRVEMDEVTVSSERYAYFLLHKPKGVISATKDRRTTVIDLLSEADRKRPLFPVGRLDRDTTGLLLLTDDGRMAHALLSPKHHVEKEYLATLDVPADESLIRRFQEGILLHPENRRTLPAKLEILPRSQARVIIAEGKYHQVKRMFSSCGRDVKELARIRMGSLVLDPSLSVGSYRPLTSEELTSLRQIVEKREPCSKKELE